MSSKPKFKYEKILRGLGYEPIPLKSSLAKYQAWKHKEYKHKVVIVGEDWDACFDVPDKAPVSRRGHGVVSLSRSLMDFHQCKFEFVKET